LSVIKQGEHIFIAGRTGSGKSELAQIYLSGKDNAICLDTKGTEDWKRIQDVKVFTRLDELVNFGIGKAIYRPRWEELNQQYYNSFFEWIYKRGNTDVWVDEITSVCPSANVIPDYYKGCLTRGRTLGISIWSLTQRPKDIPLVTMSESKHFFIFDLNLENDRKRVQEIIACNEIKLLPSKVFEEFSFWYYNFKMEMPVIGKIKI